MLYKRGIRFAFFCDSFTRDFGLRFTYTQLWFVIHLHVKFVCDLTVSGRDHIPFFVSDALCLAIGSGVPLQPRDYVLTFQGYRHVGRSV